MKFEKFYVHAPAESVKAFRLMILLVVAPGVITLAPQEPLLSLVYFVVGTGIWLALRIKG